MKETLENLQRIVKGTPITVEWYNEYLGKVLLTRADGEEMVLQLNQNTLISATEVTKANVQVWKRDRKK